MKILKMPGISKSQLARYLGLSRATVTRKIETNEIREIPIKCPSGQEIQGFEVPQYLVIIAKGRKKQREATGVTL